MKSMSMEKINKSHIVIFLLGMICINISSIDRYVFSMSDFVNGMIKGLGIGLLVFFIIAQAKIKSKSPKEY